MQVKSPHKEFICHEFQNEKALLTLISAHKEPDWIDVLVVYAIITAISKVDNNKQQVEVKVTA